MRPIAFTLIFWLCSTVLPYAQEPPLKLPVLGWLSPATTQSYQRPGPGNPGPQLLRNSLAKHGLVDGKNIRLDLRLGEGKLDLLPGLAQALVRDGATVILAYGEEAGRAAQAATKTLPIVCVGDDLVDSGLAASLARPGKNPRNRARREENRSVERAASGCQALWGTKRSGDKRSRASTKDGRNCAPSRYRTSDDRYPWP